MKRFRLIVFCVCALALASSAFAGSWRIDARFGGGYTYGWDWRSYGVQVSNFDMRRFPRPGSQPPGWHGGWHPGWDGWHPWHSGYGYPGWYPWGGGRVILLDAPGLVYTYPVYRGVTVIEPYGVVSGPVVESRSSVRTGGVFMVPESSLRDGSVERLEGVNAPLFQPRTDPTLAARADNPRPPATLAKVSAAFKLGNLVRAESELNALLRRNPSDAQLSALYAYVLFLREKYATSAYVLRRALVLDPNVVTSGVAGLGGFYDAGQSASGLARLSEHLGGRPDDVAARFVRANVLFLDGNKDAAGADLKACLEANQDDGQAALLLKACTPPGEAVP